MSRDFNIQRVEFNECTRLPNPSISPRQALEYASDRKSHAATSEFIQSNPSLKLFLSELKIATMRDKPDDILDYLVDEFFSERNQVYIKEKILEHENIAYKLQNGGDLEY